MEFLSKEELYFSLWCKELELAGYIDSWAEAKTYPLGEKIVNTYNEVKKTKTVPKEQTILNGCEYTPDFEIHWNKKALNIFYDYFPTINSKVNTKLFIANNDEPIYKSIIEVKPSFDQNNMTRLNTTNRKWMYQKYSIFVNLIKVPDIFKDTFTPKSYLMTDTGKQQRIIHFETKTLEQYVKQQTNES
jgi:hypothetical protein